nr:carotenoid 9,10(9',10')-cleavage dioxygenase 1-like [Ipomoea batatas]
MGTSHFGTLPLMRCSLERSSSIPKKSNNLISTLLSSSFKHNVPTSLKETCVRLLDAFVDLVYEFKDQPWLPSQANFAPVEEREEAITVYNIQGIIPYDFPEGVYLRNGFPITEKLVSKIRSFDHSTLLLLHYFRTFRNFDHFEGSANFAPVESRGKKLLLYTQYTRIIPYDFLRVFTSEIWRANPIFGGLKIAESIFGKSSQLWVEGEGMIHALYFNKDSNGHWTVSYNNKLVQTGTFQVEKHRKRPAFLPTVEGDPLAVLSAIILNSWRFGKLTKEYANTNCFMHSGRVYAITENHLPFEIDISTLQTLGSWDVNGGWTRPFTSHAKKAPSSGELVTMGFDPQKPFFEVGVISADGKKVVHKADLKFNRCTFCHEIGVTLRYNVILDFPIMLDARVLIKGNSFIKYDSKEFARIGVMPRYGDADSVTWFEVEPCVVFHIINCYEEDNEGSDESSVEGLFFTRVHEWRLNIKSGEVKSRFLTGSQCMAKYGGIAKLYLEEGEGEELIKVEYHMLPQNTFCTGAVFVAKAGGNEEDDGWIVTFVHDENTNKSQPLLRELQHNNVATTLKETSVRLLDAFVDLVYEFKDAGLSQANFAPVEEMEKAITIYNIQGIIPHDFPEGVYLRNGANPIFGGLKIAESIFGKSSQIWVEGEGMIHALYFNKDSNGHWTISYNNKHIQTGTFQAEKHRKRPAFLPTAEGDLLAILSAILLNSLRFGKLTKEYANTSCLMHSGKVYAITENHLPFEIDISSLQTLGSWDVNGGWTRPFTSHAKKVVHKVDLKFNRCTFCHEIGVTLRYNVILDFPMVLDARLLIKGNSSIKYDSQEFARIGVMPRYGDADSVTWFEVEPCIAKYGGIAKLYLEEIEGEELIKVDYHMLPQNTFCTGAVFVAKTGGNEEDDGWIVTFVHDENTNKSQIDTNSRQGFSDGRWWRSVLKLSLLPTGKDIIPFSA